MNIPQRSRLPAGGGAVLKRETHREAEVGDPTALHLQAAENEGRIITEVEGPAERVSSVPGTVLKP